MFLKTIELENFKSFGRRTVINFRKGYTAVTGPNGSGKSNIGDALLFVLGTKSNKILRAQKLTDLIYKGPSGRMSSYLKASITFDNSDRAIPLESNEVTFTRIVKINENNEDYSSSYFINDEKARLQDFEFLLERAKIFADGYNFVRQGDITRIIEMSPNERRQILEEVGGITTYNQELEKARLEKDKVSENLITVSALLSEITTRVQLLNSEKEVAERYLAKKKRITELEGALLYRRKKSVESEISALSEQINKIKTEILNNETEISRMVKESEDIEIKIKGLEGDNKEIENLNKLKQDIDNLKLEIARSEMENENSHARLSQIKSDLGKIKEEYSTDIKKLENIKKELEKVGNEFKEIESVLRDKEREKSAIENENALNIEESKKIITRIEELHNEKDKINNDISNLKNRIASIDVQRLNLMKEISDIEEAIGNLEFSVKDIDWRIKSSSQAPKHGESIKQKYLELKNEISELRSKELAITKEIETLQVELGRIQGSKLSGIWESIDFIMREAANGSLKGIRGTVDSLIKYDGELELAVQAAGSNRLYSIIVDTDENAQAAIELLKKKGKGRLTFLPLNKMIPLRPKGKSLLLMNDPRTMGLIINHVEYPKDIEAAVTYVFSDTILTKDLAIAREVMGGIRIVTLDGDLIDPTNAMTGGSHMQRGIDKNAERINSRLALLRSEREEIIKKIELLDQEMRRMAEELNEINLKVGIEEGSVRQLKDRKSEIEIELKNKKESLNIKKDKIIEIEKELSELNSGVSNLNAQLVKIEKELLDLQSKKGKLLSDEARERLGTLDGEIVELRNELSSKGSKKNSLEREELLLNDRLQFLDNSMRSLEAEIANLNDKSAKLKKEIEEKRRKLEGMNKIFNDMQNELKAREAELLELINKRNEIKNKIEGIQTLNKTNFDFKLQIESKLEETRKRLDEINREILEKNVGEIQLQLSNDDIRKEITLLENQLKEMEPVNLKAIEEYSSEKIRMDELVSRKEKLNEEMSKLNDLEKKLEEQKKVVFIDVFNEVNKNFISIYGELTSGQQGYLELENITNPFEGGLILKASSKGKKVDNLASLSGGEKSLAALAFILAIQEYDPSPIYYMDEVDMFLDGVNAENVGRLFRRNSERAQIIAVTLRKSTMKYAHQMIGVSYQDRSSTVFTKEIVQEATMT